MVALLDPKLNHHTLSRTNVLVATFTTLALVLPIAAAQRPSVPIPAQNQATKAEKPHSPPEQPQILRKITEIAAHQQPRDEQKEPKQRTGRIWGRVYDASGAVIPLALVTLINSDLKVTQSVSTNDAGIFEFPAIPAGRHLLEVRKPGFAFLEGQSLHLKPGADLRLDVVLNIATVAESITVVEKSHRKAAPAPIQKPVRIRVGGNIEQSKQIFAPKPEYPPEAKEKGVEGTVLLNAVIGMDGVVLDIRVINEPDPELAKAAVDAVKQWRYMPTLLNGQPVEVVTTITVSFRLENSPDGGN